jgi:hypothetical protein
MSIEQRVAALEKQTASRGVSHESDEEFAEALAHIYGLPVEPMRVAGDREAFYRRLELVYGGDDGDP